MIKELSLKNTQITLAGLQPDCLSISVTWLRCEAHAHEFLFDEFTSRALT